MPSLHHAIKVATPRDATFEALSTVAGMRRWHLGTIEGDIKPGAVLRLIPRPGLRVHPRFAWIVTERD